MIARTKADHRYGRILLCYIKGDEAALSLYKNWDLHILEKEMEMKL